MVKGVFEEEIIPVLVEESRKECSLLAVEVTLDLVQ